PALGHIPLRKLRPEHIAAAETEWLEHGAGARTLSRRTVLHYHRGLHTALEGAGKWQRSGGNPSHRLEPPTADPREIVTLSHAESRRLMAVAGRDLRSQAVLVGLHLGLREGEVLGLRWRDVDLEVNRVSVRQTVNQLQGLGLVLRATPKNKSSRRSV